MNESAPIGQILDQAFKEGGWGMWWVLTFGLVALGLVFERVFVLLGASANRRRLMQRVRRLVARGDLAEALRVCARMRRPVARVVGAGLLCSGRGRSMAQHVVEAALERERHELERRADHLTVLASVATAAGVLGTLVGAVKTTTCMCCCSTT
jgi:biopolymer transport protein ExbB